MKNGGGRRSIKKNRDFRASIRLINIYSILQENEREEKVTRRESELDTICNNVKLLNEMLDSYDPTRVSTSELDIIKVLLYSRTWLCK